jgi:hypothetical protein
MFGLGIIAFRHRWLARITGRFACLVAAVCLVIASMSWWPLLSYGGAFQGRLAPYGGGLHWQSAAMTIWEALVCVGMAFAVLAGFRAFAAGQRPFTRFMADNAFAVYVIHPPLLIAIALAMAGLAVPAVAKFLLLWVLSAALCFGLAAPLARRLPLVGRILQ